MEWLYFSAASFRGVSFFFHLDQTPFWGVPWTMSGTKENSRDKLQPGPLPHSRTSSQSPAQYARESFDQFQSLGMDTPARIDSRRREFREKFTPTLGSSPHVSSETAAVDHNEYSSFGLMNSSFDTLSDGGKTYDAGHGSLFSPHQRDHCSNDGLLLHHQSPPVNASHHEVASDDSIGDISPIKVVYASNNDGVASYPANTLRDSTRYVQRTRRDTSVIPLEWMQDDDDRYNPQGNRSNPVYVLKSSRKAFEKVKYLLPSLGSTMGACPVHLSDYGSIRQYKEKKDHEGTSVDLIVATRRVEASICAFGGTVNRSRKQQTWSIFRHKVDYTEARHEYERVLPSRYHVGGSNISWDVEENPPVSRHVTDVCSFESQEVRGNEARRMKGDNSDDDTESLTSPPGNSAETNTYEALSDAAKMRYKCKLCGQLKQNHTCPYQQALQRSIGVMVYPTVNAFTSAEPGVFTQALTKMNNFVSYYSDQSTLHHGENTPRSTRGSIYPTHPSTITPETPRIGPVANSPQSSLSAQSSEDPAICGTGPPSHVTKSSSRGLKRSHEQVLDDTYPPFVASVVLRPEQYRAVTPLKTEDINADLDAPATTAYQYPVVPLTFAERKRLSDTLFYLSKEIPSMTNDCAAVLQDARQNNEWDLAVAELLTQLVVGLYCSETDARLDGLQQYLLNIGITC